MIRVTSQKLRDTASQLRQMNGDLKNKAEAFTTAANNLLTKWDGDTKQVEEKNFRNDRVQIDNFMTLIEEYCVSLEDQARRYDDKEAENVQIASNRTYK